MNLASRLPTILLALLLSACVVAYYLTGKTTEPTGASSDAQMLDNSLFKGVARMASLAAPTLEEQDRAREAYRLADHELDLAFATALRQAAAATALPLTGPLHEMSDRIASLNQRVDMDRNRVASLGKVNSKELELAQALLELDQDELDSAQREFAHAGGNPRSRLQSLLQEHEAASKAGPDSMIFPKPPAAGTLSEQLAAWVSIASSKRELLTAAQSAGAHSNALLQRKFSLERQLQSPAVEPLSAANLKALSAQRKELDEIDDRIADARQLSGVYQRWSALAQSRQRAVLHGLLGSLAAIFAILMVTVLINGAAQGAFQASDARRLHQMRMIVRIAAQVAAVLLILVIVFGPPTQFLSTIIGLATAGLTVVAKDYIVAFFGWFRLTGTDGIRVGDWVEIEGVSGEVAEVRLLKTVLLEQGSGAETGQTTGRRVAFSNAFAIEGHYFNFSMTGQWLWDEVRVMLPPGKDPHDAARQVSEIVERETRADSAEAANDWERLSRQQGKRDFSAVSAVNLRPGGGLDVVVRYVTRAPQRNSVKSRLLQEVAALLQKHSSQQAAEGVA